jgi:hypothetical protein
VIRNRSASAQHSVPPDSSSPGLRVELIDQRTLRCAQPARHPFQSLQRPQPFRGGEHVKRQLTQAVQGAIERVEDSTISSRLLQPMPQILRPATGSNQPVLTS